MMQQHPKPKVFKVQNRWYAYCHPMVRGFATWRQALEFVRASR